MDPGYVPFAVKIDGPSNVIKEFQWISPDHVLIISSHSIDIYEMV